MVKFDSDYDGEIILKFEGKAYELEKLELEIKEIVEKYLTIKTEEI